MLVFLQYAMLFTVRRECKQAWKTALQAANSLDIWNDRFSSLWHFFGIASFLFEMPKISASITPYHTYPKICACPFGLHEELTRAVLSANTYGICCFFVFLLAVCWWARKPMHQQNGQGTKVLGQIGLCKQCIPRSDAAECGVWYFG